MLQGLPCIVSASTLRTPWTWGYGEFAGSLLWTMVYDGDLAGGAEAKLEAVWARVRQLYEEKRVE
eukprot:12032030-Alexandrium_andersonii.AAC.1